MTLELFSCKGDGQEASRRYLEVPQNCFRLISLTLVSNDNKHGTRLIVSPVSL